MAPSLAGEVLQLDLTWSLAGDVTSPYGASIRASCIGQDVLYTADRSGIHKWDTNSAKSRLLIGSESLTSLVHCLLKTESVLWAGLGDGTVGLFDALTMLPRRKAIRAHKGEVTCLIRSLQSTHVLTGGADCCVRIWDSCGEYLCSIPFNHGTILTLHQYQDQLWSACSDGTIIATKLSFNGTKHSESTSWMSTPAEKGPRKGVTSIIYFDGSLICGCESGELLKLRNDEITQRRHLHQSRITTLTIVADQLWTGSSDRQIYTVDPRSFETVHGIGDQGSYIRSIYCLGEKIWTIHGKGIRIFAFDTLWWKKINHIEESCKNQELEMSNEITSLSEDLSSKDHENYSLLLQMESLQKGHKKEMCDSEAKHKQELDQLNGKYQNLLYSRNQQIKELSDVNSTLRCQATENLCEIQHLKTDLNNSQSSTQRMKDEIKLYQKRQSWMESLFDVIENVHGELNQLKTETERAQVYSDQLVADLAQRYKECTRLTRQNGELQTKCVHVAKEKKTTEACLDNCRNDIESKAQEIKHLQELANDQCVEIENLKVEYCSAEKSALEKCDILANQHKQQLEQVTKRHALEQLAVEEHNKQLEDQLREMEQNLDESKKEISRLAVDKKENEGKMDKLIESENLLLYQLSEAKGQISDLKVICQEVECALEMKENSIQDLAQKLKEKHLDLESRNNMITTGLQTEEEQQADRTKEINHLECMYQQEIRAKTEELEQLRHFVESQYGGETKEELEQLRVICQNAEYRRNTLENRIHQLQEENQLLEESKLKLESDYNNLERETEDLKAKNALLVDKSTKTENFSLNLKTLERDHEKNKNEVQKLRNRLENHSRDSTRCDRRVEHGCHSDASLKIKCIQNELREAVRDYQIALDQIQKLKEQVKLKDEALHQQSVEYKKVIYKLNALTKDYQNIMTPSDSLNEQAENRKSSYPSNISQRAISKTIRWIPPTGNC